MSDLVSGIERQKKKYVNDWEWVWVSEFDGDEECTVIWF